ncbi:MAG: type I-C CRISPR-associated protein Cas5c [Sphaerochaetaceae bacterium]|nr:type I-C CRISPR-associated protein Cas5c [Spirochaetales bacterium]MDY5500714.1 type I-C CRISPR-associated protein Cas5c [Sphaerochaetaceae bacterium]
MEQRGREFCLDVAGPYACFTRPEFKVERVSYDVITPSAARSIFEAIFWKPAFRWQVTKIEIMNPIKWFSIRRNEVGALASLGKSSIFIEDLRQQRNALMLKDVRYRLYAFQVLKDSEERKGEKHSPGDDENIGKYQAMFERRASKGQCFTQPYLGTRECACSFRLVEDIGKEPKAFDVNADFGYMLYDLDFSNPKDIGRLLYRPSAEHGVIIVPPLDSEEVLR